MNKVLVSMREVIITSVLLGFDQRNRIFEGWSWFRFNNLRLAISTNLKMYTSVAKGLKLKARKFWGLIPTFVEVTGEKLVGRGGAFWPPILNRVKSYINCEVNCICAYTFSKSKVTLKKKWQFWKQGIPKWLGRT